MQKLTAILIAIALTGCATVGREVSDAQISTLKKGETTTTTAIQSLGQPTSVTKMSDGSQKLTYSFANVQVRPSTFIPVVGLFAGGSDVRSSAIVLTFDQSGVLQDYTSHQSVTGHGMGFAPGAYTPPESTTPQ